MLKSRINLDANAGAALRPCAKAAISQFCEQAGALGNPSSIHESGRSARALLERARESTASFLGLSSADSAKIVFTSGGTEACNSLIRGFIGSAKNPAHLVATAVEHPAVLEPLSDMESQSCTLDLLPVDACARIEHSSIDAFLRPDTALFAMMAANNEIGSLQPLLESAQRVRKLGYGGPIISDITQALGKTSFSLKEVFEAGVDAVAFSGHKLGAPAGVGAFVLSPSSSVCREFFPLVLGGPQEQGLRAGSENLLGIAGLAAVAEYLSEEGENEIEKTSALRKEFWQALSLEISGLVPLTPFYSCESKCVSNTLSLRVPACRADDLVVALDLNGISASTGAACSSGRQDVSAVLRAISMPEDSAREVIRLSLDWDFTKEQLDSAVSTIASVVAQMRAGSSSFGEERAHA